MLALFKGLPTGRPPPTSVMVICEAAKHWPPFQQFQPAMGALMTELALVVDHHVLRTAIESRYAGFHHCSAKPYAAPSLLPPQIN